MPERQKPTRRGSRFRRGGPHRGRCRSGDSRPFRNAFQHGARFLGVAASLVSILLVGGCVPTRPVPPGLTIRDNALVSVPGAAVSVDTDYLLMEWFLQRYGNAPDAASARRAARRRQQRAAEGLVQRWLARVLKDYAPFLRAEGGGRLHLDPRTFTGTEDPAELLTLLEGLKAEIEGGIPVEFDPRSCLAEALWQNAAEGDREHFAAWAQRFPGRFPPPEELEAPRFLIQVERLNAVVRQKERMLRTLRTAERAEELRDFAGALDLLLKAKAELGDGADLARIGDRQTLREVDRRLYYVAQLSVSDGLGDIEREAVERAEESAAQSGMDPAPAPLAEQLIGEAERRLSAALREWSSAPLFAVGLAKYAPVVNELTWRLCRLRGDAWRRRLRSLAKQQSAWNAAVYLRYRLAELGDEENERFFCYRYVDDRARDAESPNEPATCREFLGKSACEEYCRALPQAFRELLKTADRQAELSLKHGTRIAMATLVTAMARIVPPEWLPNEVAARVAEAEERLASSQAFFLRHMAKRSIVIEEFQAAIPGLGMTFRNDLRQLLDALFDPSAVGALAGFVSIVGETSRIQPADYAIRNGYVAEYEVSEGPETVAFRTLKRWGPIVRKGAEKGAPPPEPGTAAVYEQALLEYAVRVRRVDRVGHTRLSFDIVHGETKETVSLNYFFTKSFIQEQVHPFTDVREVERKRAARPDDLQPPEPEPELRKDRVWTDSRMLDWMRPMAQELAVLPLIRRILQLPLDLQTQAEAAEQAGNWLEATNLWGYCLAYCRQLSVGSEAESRFVAGLGERLRSECLDERARQDLQAALDQIDRLAKLKAQMEDKISLAVVRAMAGLEAPVSEERE